MLRRSLPFLALRRAFVTLAQASHARASESPVHVDEEFEQPPAATVVPGGTIDRTHVVPEVVLRDLTNAISKAQASFLTGSRGDTNDAYSETFLGMINGAYEGRLQQEQQVEVDAYVAKRRRHYDQRMDEETEEFRRERREVHSELQRIECDKYKEDLVRDIAEFAAARQKDCEARLRKDVDKYHAALQSYRARQAQRAKEAAIDADFDDLDKNLLADVSAAVDQLEAETRLFDFGAGAKGFGNDLTDEDISEYVEGRLRFYERTLQDEIDYFTHRRRAFYEELIQARAIRHAAKIRSDTEKFRLKRSDYYRRRLGDDAVWMAKSFQGHYERCLLSCYTRQAWLMHRQGGASGLGSTADVSKLSMEELSEQLPLSKVLDVYASETIEEISRDAFLKAARRIDGETPYTSPHAHQQNTAEEA